MQSAKTAEDILSEKGSDILFVSPNTTIYEALKIMLDRGVGSVLIKDGMEFTGIWTERDLMKNTVTENFDPKTAKISEYMTPRLIFAKHDDNIYSLADQFLGRRLRHLLIEREGKCIGVLSAGDIIRAGLQERTEQWERLNDIVKLEFYDQWRWHKKVKK
jgi:signal-transduction protein with cAMP-binding, CBS, and nucleotidyltransferase domain